MCCILYSIYFNAISSTAKNSKINLKIKKKIYTKSSFNENTIGNQVFQSLMPLLNSDRFGCSNGKTNLWNYKLLKKLSKYKKIIKNQIGLDFRQ